MTSIGSSSSLEAPEPAAARADLAVGLLSDNDADTIGDVALAVRAGLSSGLDTIESRVLLADPGSSDGTIAKARSALASKSADLVEVPYAPLPGDLLNVPYHGLPARARALRAVLQASRDLDAQSIVVLDAGLRTIAPEWIPALAMPVLREGYDYVSPYYHRHPYEGALTKGLVYPLFRALYGVALRQPAVGELGCSARFAAAVLDEDLWERDGAQIGIDIWLAELAATGDFKIAETPLGIRGHRHRTEHALGLEATIVQVVGAAFTDLEGRADVWQRVRRTTRAPVMGDPPVVPPVDPPTLDVERLMESFRLGYRELRDIWSWVIPPKAIIDLRRLATATSNQFRFDDELWARIVYDFALGYRMRSLPRDHLLKSLTPLYVGWLASFILQIPDAQPEAAEARIERLAVAFEAQKAYLVSRWRWPERFRT
jgi:glucosylglycerate synthase